MEASLFIVWRESVEALLVIGILYAWLKRNHATQLIYKLWLGIIIGLILACILAGAFWFAGNWFSGAGGEYFFTFMMFVAALLILQMIVWMHHNGQKIKGELESQAQKALQSSRSAWGIAILAMIAIAREGSETVVFLYGIGLQQTGTSLASFILGGFIGFILAILTFFCLQYSHHIISWKWFFRISEFVLIMLGGAMMVSALDKFTGQILTYDLPEFMFSFLTDPLWDSSWLISDNSTLTGLTGYHATPAFAQILILLIYWGLAIFFCHPRTTPFKTAENF